MKVTKTIREFVETQVAERINAKYHDELTTAKTLKEENEKQYLNAVNAFQERVTKEFKEILKDFNHPNSQECHVSLCSYYYDLPTSAQYQKLKTEISQEIASTTNNILASLELGGTKAELMRMLEEINS